MAEEDFPYGVATSSWCDNLQDRREFCSTSYLFSARDLADEAEIAHVEERLRMIKEKLDTDHEFRNAVALFLTLDLRDGSKFVARTGMRSVGPILRWMRDSQAQVERRLWQTKEDAIAQRIEKACLALLKSIGSKP